MSNYNTCMLSPDEQYGSSFRYLPLKRESLDNTVLNSSSQLEHPAGVAVILASLPIREKVVNRMKAPIVTSHPRPQSLKISSIDLPVPATQSDEQAISNSKAGMTVPETSGSMIDAYGPVRKKPSEFKKITSVTTISDPKVEDCKQMSQLQASNCEQMSKMDLDLDFDVDWYVNGGTQPKIGELKMYRKMLSRRLPVFEKLGRGESISSE